MSNTPEPNLIIEVDNVARCKFTHTERQQALLTLLEAAGANAFCFALASLMDVENRVRQIQQKGS
ncbi:TPA: hypothetical protein R8G68_000294 [Citrobacter youngae]|uniref:hypothetical protein n=1 Tax=Citrobacter TaxID=544 RepID=UPI0025766188|nr:hypothetical protein [Citrobacter sp. Cu233]MDM2933735.1 hypothetical protein [Citrobacter sp. Cu233]HDX4037665.1 hypothetical protein [Citrobacter youngae]HEF0097768.1 hypothetical protein [Citrobacter youngae]